MRLLTHQQVVGWLNVHVNTVDRVRRGDPTVLQPVHIGEALRWRPDDVGHPRHVIPPPSGTASGSRRPRAYAGDGPNGTYPEVADSESSNRRSGPRA